MGLHGKIGNHVRWFMQDCRVFRLFLLIATAMKIIVLFGSNYILNITFGWILFMKFRNLCVYTWQEYVLGIVPVNKMEKHLESSRFVTIA